MQDAIKYETFGPNENHGKWSRYLLKLIMMDQFSRVYFLVWQLWLWLSYGFWQPLAGGNNMACCWACYKIKASSSSLIYNEINELLATLE